MLAQLSKMVTPSVITNNINKAFGRIFGAAMVKIKLHLSYTQPHSQPLTQRVISWTAAANMVWQPDIFWYC